MKKLLTVVCFVFLLSILFLETSSAEIVSNTEGKIVLQNNYTGENYEYAGPVDATVYDKDVSGKYYGETKDGKAHGYGRAEGADIYEGYFFKGYFNGRGKYLWRRAPWKNDIYEGEWSFGENTGHGKYIYNNKSVYDTYEGEFLDGAWHGYGKMIFGNGSIYEGQWNNNKMSGQGKLTVENKETGLKMILEGNFSQYKSDSTNSLNGPGKMTIIKNGKEYIHEGNFSGNIPTDEMEFASFLIETGLDGLNNDNDNSITKGQQNNDTQAVSIDNSVFLKAFEKINFGDSKKEVKKKIGDSEVIKTQLFGSIIHIYLNNYEYLMHFNYHNDKLYRIRFRTPENDKDSADYFNTLIKKQRNILVETITHQYGQPDSQRRLSILNMDNGYIKWSHIWEIDDIKRIKVGIGEDDYSYYAAMWIEYLPIVEEIAAEEEKEKNDSIEDSASNF